MGLAWEAARGRKRAPGIARAVCWRLARTWRRLRPPARLCLMHQALRSRRAPREARRLASGVDLHTRAQGASGQRRSQRGDLHTLRRRQRMTGARRRSPLHLRAARLASCARSAPLARLERLAGSPHKICISWHHTWRASRSHRRRRARSRLIRDGRWSPCVIRHSTRVGDIHHRRSAIHRHDRLRTTRARGRDHQCAERHDAEAERTLGGTTREVRRWRDLRM